MPSDETTTWLIALAHWHRADLAVQTFPGDLRGEAYQALCAEADRTQVALMRAFEAAVDARVQAVVARMEVRGQ